MTTRARNYLLLACGTAVALTFGLHGVAPGLPVVQEAFGLSDFEVGIITSAYVLPGVVFAVPLGVVADLLGRRRVFSSAALLYGLMGVAQGLAPTFEWLLVWRLGQGLAFAALMPLTVTVIGDAFTGIAQVRAQAQRQVSMAASSLVVPIIGAQLAATVWSLPFTAQSVMVVPAVLALVVLDRGGRSEMVQRDGYVRRAMRSVGRRGFPSVLTLGFLRFFARFSILGFLPIHLTRQLDASLPTVGIVMGVTTGLGFASAMVAARLSTRVRPSRIVLGALTAVGLALVGFAVPVGLVAVLAVGVVYALADGLIAVLQSAYAARGAPAEVRAGLVAVNGTARNGGKFVGPLVIGSVASVVGIGAALAAVGVVVMGAALLLPRGLAEFDGALQEVESRIEAT